MAQCRACGAEIRFEKNVNGRWEPISLETGETHFIDCPEAKTFRKPALPDNVCTSCGSLDVEKQPPKGPHTGGAIRCNDCRAWRWLRKPAS